MGNSKVIFGNETLIDLTGDTVTPDTLLAGTTAHNRSGEQIVGTATVPEELGDLTDVTLTSPAEGDLLQRDGNGKWVNSAKIPQKVAELQNTYSKQDTIADVESTSTSFKAYAVGDLLYYEGVLYKVTTAIAQGDSIVTTGASANVEATTVTDALKSGTISDVEDMFNGTWEDA